MIPTDSPLILDIGGEGRHPTAWNLNPRGLKSFGPEQGTRIPRWIAGRGEQIPLPDNCVDVLIVERTPLRPATLAEMARVVKPSGTAILRHAVGPLGNPHRLATRVLRGRTSARMTSIGKIVVQETVVTLSEESL